MASSDSGKMVSKIHSRHIWLCPCRYCRSTNNVKAARALDRRRAKDEIREQVEA